jgi:hypothetical protein
MTTRNDVVVNWEVSPRIITVLAPSVEITVQDLVDTLRVLEADIQNMDEPAIISAAGKEDLGGGVSVGITATMQDAKLAFEARVIPDETGTVTSALPDPSTSFADSSATFITNGIVPGAVVINHDTGASATVLEVVSETELRHEALDGGTSGLWSVSDTYAVHNVIQCNISGGNLVAVDDVGATIDPVFTTAFTQIVRTSSSSATLQELEAIQFASFDGGVWVDVTSPYSGIVFPTGTPQQPVNNLDDAELIAAERGFKKLYVLGDITFDSLADLADFDIEGESEQKSSFTIDAASTMTNCEFRFANLTGTLDGGNYIEHCRIGSLSFVDGIIEQCVIDGPITLSGANDAHFLDCWSGVPGASTPTINLGGSGAALALRNYNGGVTLTNLSGNENVSIDMASGQIILDATITNGTIVCRGIGKLIDNSDGATVINEMIDSSFISTLEFTAYQGAVSLAQSLAPDFGNQYPVGTEQQPANTFSSAKTIASAQGLGTYQLKDNVVLGAGDSEIGKVFRGEGPANTLISLNTGASFDNCVFENATITGRLGANVLVRNCVVSNVSAIESGDFIDCTFLETANLVLTGTSSDRVRVINCRSGSHDYNTMLDINMGGDGPQLVVRDYIGSVELSNKSGAARASIDMPTGVLSITGTVTAGDIEISGVPDVQEAQQNPSYQTFRVDWLTGMIRNLTSLARNRVETDPNTGRMRVYNDQDTAVLFETDIWEDVNGTIRYRGDGINRKDKL